MTTQSPEVELLTTDTIGSESQSAVPVDNSRCQHRYKNGKRCRLPGSEAQLGLCPGHFRQRVARGLPPTDDSSDLSQELLRGIKFSSAEDVREFLTRLLVQMAKGRVSPRRAAVLAYVTNQLLHSHVVAEKESADEEPQIIFDLPRPNRDDPVNPETAYYERMGKYNVSAKIDPSTAPDGYDGYTSDMDKSK